MAGQQAPATALGKAFYNSLTWPDGTAYTADDLQLVNYSQIDPLVGPRGSRGLTKKESVWNDASLYKLANNGIDLQGDDSYTLAVRGYAKGPNDSPGTTGWASDFNDVQSNNNWGVYIDRPDIVPTTPTTKGTVFYWPINGGSDGQYAKFSISVKPDAASRHQATAQGPASGQYGGSTTTSGASAYTGSLKGAELSWIKDGNSPNGGRFWYAKSQTQSAAASGPHPGKWYAGDNVWQAAWGDPKDNELPPNIRLVTADDFTDDSTVRPASIELKRAVVMAANGDAAAQEMLDYLGVPVPSETTLARFRGLFGL